LIIIDTSAFMAVLLDEPEAARCIEVMTDAPHLAISGGTLGEMLIVAGRRGARAALDRLLARLQPDIVPVTLADARLVGDADFSRTDVVPA
jgi:ribonuclease VapC